ncbi:MAG: DUF5777 family beta-barrel protein [Vicinamibacterales bacterium]
MTRATLRLAAALALSLACAPAAFAQDDAELRLAEQDFSLVSLPTALRLPRNGSAFRVTHRFTRPLGEGSFGDLAGDLFGIDSGAQIGLEYRYGLIKNGQIGVHRTNDKTVMFFGQYGLVRQGSSPLDVSILASIDGTNNFQDSYSPTLGVILSRTFGDRGAIYVEPMWINNTNPLPSAVTDDNDTIVVGVGARVRIRPTVYLVGEMAPRSGYTPGSNHASFAIEKRAGGHTFQLNFSNSFATTRRQLGLGGPSGDNWYFGFNISRKFF